MQGMHFLLLGENGQPINHGVIQQKTTEERYLCTFLRQPQVSRLCHVDEIGTWNLFPNQEAMNSFITSIQQQAANKPPAGPEGLVKSEAHRGKDPIGDDSIGRDADGNKIHRLPPGAPKPTKKKAKKKVAKKKVAKKKVSKKKANAKTKR